MELARVTTVRLELQLLPWNKVIAICLDTLGGDLSGESLREPNSPFPILSAEASASPTDHIYH